MNHIEITIQADGTGSIRVGTATTPISGPSVQDTRRIAIERVAAHARTSGVPTDVTANDPSGTYELTVYPDGSVRDRPAAPADGWEQVPPAAAPAPAPVAEPEADHEADLDLDQTVVRRPGPAPATPEPDAWTTSAPTPERSHRAEPTPTVAPPAPTPAPVDETTAPGRGPVGGAAADRGWDPSAPWDSSGGWDTAAPGGSPAGASRPAAPADAPQGPVGTVGRDAPPVGPAAPLSAPVEYVGPPAGPAPSATPAAAPSPSVPSPSAPVGDATGRIPAPPRSARAELFADETPLISPAEQDPRWTDIAAKPATEGFRGMLNTLGMSLAPTEEELAERRRELAATMRSEESEREAQSAREAEETSRRSRRAARARDDAQRDRDQRGLIQTNFQGTRTVIVANPKGGSRKTTTTYVMAATMGMIRGGSVIAWDANETMGTLGERSHQDDHERTVVDLLHSAPEEFGSVQSSRLGLLDRFVRPQGDAHFDVLASDEDPTRQDIVDAAGFDTVHEILQRFYRMIFIDTGNNIRVSHFLAAVEHADQLVIPVAAGRDSARAARKMMEALSAAGHEDLVGRAVVLIHDLEASADAGDEYLEITRTVAAEFEGRVGGVFPIPFDPALKDGDVIEYDALQPSTRRAYQDAAAAIASGLREASRAS